MAGRSSSEAGNSRAEDVADYVETMARELKGMVEPHGMLTLAYLLDLVRLEAAAQSKTGRIDLSPEARD